MPPRLSQDSRSSVRDDSHLPYVPGQIIGGSFNPVGFLYESRWCISIRIIQFHGWSYSLTPSVLMNSQAVLGINSAIFGEGSSSW